MFTGLDKAIAGLLGPLIGTGLLWLSNKLGVPAFGPEVVLGITGLITGVLVYFIPNKGAA